MVQKKIIDFKEHTDGRGSDTHGRIQNAAGTGEEIFEQVFKIYTR